MPTVVDDLRRILEEQGDGGSLGILHFDRTSHVTLARAVVELADRLDALETSLDERIDTAARGRVKEMTGRARELVNQRKQQLSGDAASEEDQEDAVVE